MVAAPAAAGAVTRSRRLPGLCVGLHVALVDADSLLDPAEIPDLVGPDRRFSDRQALAGMRYFVRPAVRRQLEAEIRAQFRAFAATGLPLGHVDAHKHMHLHPTVGRLLVELAAEHGCRAVRVPREPGGGLADALLAPWLGLLRRRVRRTGMVCADRVYGIRWSGAMTVERVAGIIRTLPDGVSELYLHPAVETTPALAAAMPGYRHAEELAALTSLAVKRMVREQGVSLTTYGALAPSAAGEPR